MWAHELCSDAQVAETACVGYKALWAEVCVGGSTLLSASLAQGSCVEHYCGGILLSALCLLNLFITAFVFG